MDKLTRRQTEFLNQFLKIYFEENRQLHYSVIAKKLNVQNGTAYEMLRNLEKMGYLSREFHLPANHHGPGRATVYFLPTDLAMEQFIPNPEQNLLQKEWETLTHMILEKLRYGQNLDYKKWFVEFSHNNKPMIYATKMITAIVVSLASLRDTVGKKKLVDLFKMIGLGNGQGLNNLAGVGLALSLWDNVNSQLINWISQQNEPLQEALTTLEDDKKQQLSEFADEAFKIALG